MLINRGIQSSNKGSRRWINKIITNSTEGFNEALKSLLTMQSYLDDNSIRLYSSVNSRSIDKAVKLFNHKQLDLLDEQKEKFYSRINDSFSSCLMAPECRQTRHWLLDIDTKDTAETDKLIADNFIQVGFRYETPNGWHYIVEPFDKRIADGIEYFTIIKDGLLLLNCL